MSALVRPIAKLKPTASDDDIELVCNQIAAFHGLKDSTFDFHGTTSLKKDQFDKTSDLMKSQHMMDLVFERVFLKHAPKIIVNLTEELHPRPTLSRLFEFLASPNYEHGASKRWHLMPIYDQLGTSAVAAHALRKTREGQELLPRLLRWLGESAEVLAGHSFGTLRQLAPCFDILVCLAIRLMIAYKLKTDGQLDFPFVHQGDPELLDATERSFAKLIKAHRPDLARESYNHDLWGRYHRRMTVLGVLVGSSATIGSAREHLRAEVIRLADGDPWHSCYITRGEAAPCDPGGVKDACGGCGTVRYCSKEHQKAHWQIHKRACEVPSWDEVQNADSASREGELNNKDQEPTSLHDVD